MRVNCDFEQRHWNKFISIVSLDIAVVSELDFDASYIYLVLCWILNAVFELLIASAMLHKCQIFCCMLPSLSGKKSRTLILLLAL